MRMLLLVCAVTLLRGPALVSPRHTDNSDVGRHNLNRIYDLAKSCNEARTKEVFVEDVSRLTEGRKICGDEFFCKVHDILHRQENFCHGRDKEVLVRVLQAYNKQRHVQCEKTLRGTTSTGDQIEVSTFLERVMFCVQHRNTFGARK